MSNLVELDESNRLRSMVIVAATTMSITDFSWPGESFEPPNDRVWIEASRTNIHSGELVGKHSNARRFRNTFFYTVGVNVPKLFASDGIDVEGKALTTIAGLRGMFPPWAYLGPVAASTYLSNGLVTKESEMIGLIDTAIDKLFALAMLRVTVQHIYYQP